MGLGSYRCGADLAVALDVISGSIEGTLTVRIVKVPREHADYITGQGIDMTVTPQDGDGLGGYIASLTAGQTANMKPGVYAIDAKVDDGAGHTAVTDAPCFITLWPSPF